MPLTGTYLRTLDEKQRVALPKRLREDFGNHEMKHMFIAPGTNKSLVLYSPDGFNRVAEAMSRGGLPGSDQTYQRLFYASAERVDLDGQGRLRIPDRLSEYASLSHEIYLLGVNDHAEMWDRQLWETFLGTFSPQFDHLAHQGSTPRSAV
jgi:MraZ protein